ncbi:hypothetical protein PACTADRAFT_34461 [Pachysolen tannophilus NRRL Y-2460]|uniref:Mediator of RNA polymerase II transcription subunit 13 n=1 Tax=Pachysolen tannophilus NRRL Y-2460 TaxID=669874 RepID=A0A1E4TSH6_PACTA|nr:hypothetical protein PACTADRAFT_34461 [Pachysolen tannophilus NRRL Y-2460]
MSSRMIELSELNPLLQSTNYYAVGRSTEVRYYVYEYIVEEDGEDTVPINMIYQYEFAIRSKLPSNMLLLVHTKDIYLYDLNCQNEEAESGDGVENAVAAIIDEEKMKLSLVSKGSFNSKASFQNQVPRPPQQQQQQLQNKIYINFLKAVKRFFIWRLSEHKGKELKDQYIVPFGNNTIALANFEKEKAETFFYKIMIVEPMFNFNDQVLVGLSLKDYRFQKIDDKTENFTNDDYSIYLAPSGVRVYLAADSLDSSLLNEAPTNYPKLVTFLKSYCNIDLSTKKNSKFLKVIPNLSHLNNLTPAISNSLRDYNSNLKYLIWPLDYCFIQRGIDDTTDKDYDDNQSLMGNPFDLIEDFIKFNESLELDKKKEAEARSAVNTPMSFTAVTPTVHTNNDENITENNNLQSVSETKQSQFASESTENPQPHDGDGGENVENWDEELFGDYYDDDEIQKKVTEDDFDFFDDSREKADQQKTNNPNGNENEIDGKTESSIANSKAKTLNLDEEGIDDVTQVKNEFASEENRDNLNDNEQKENVSFINTKEFEKAIGSASSTFYEDPGAPAPLPLPIIKTPQTPNEDLDKSPADKKKSVFAPLNFNPVIEEKIDSKYSIGGKFYVPTDNDIDITNENVSTATIHNNSGGNNSNSMNHSFELHDPRSLAIATSSLRNDKFDSNADESQSSSSSDEYIDSNEEYEEENEEPSSRDEAILGANIFSDTNSAMSAYGGDKLTNLTISSPYKKSDLTLQNSPQISSQKFSSHNSGSQSRSYSHSPAAVSTAENQNWLPFLLKLVPNHTIPSTFLYTSPTIKYDEAEEVSLILAKNFVFDCFNQNYATAPTGFAKLNLNRDHLVNIDDELEGMVNDTFPGITRVPLYEILESTRQDNNEDRNGKENYEVLTGRGRTIVKEEENQDLERLEYTDSLFGASSPITSSQHNPDYVSKGANKKLTIPELTMKNHLFKISQPTINLKRLDQDLKANFTSLNFWNLLNLQPIGDQHDFEINMILPTIINSGNIVDEYMARSSDFLASIIENYKSSRLGRATRFKFSSDESQKLEIEGARFSGGIYQIFIEKEKATNEDKFWQVVNAKSLEFAKALQERILRVRETQQEKHCSPAEMDGGETTQFFDKPILLLLANPFDSIQSYVNISKIIHNFKKKVTTYSFSGNFDDSLSKKKKRKIESPSAEQIMKLPLKIFEKIVPIDLYCPNGQSFSVISNRKLTRISLSLYNLCPSSCKDDSLLHDSSFMDDAFTTISPDLPKKIGFRITKTSIIKSLISEDLFVHVAYERSVDKRWCVATWTDQYGTVRNMKCWYCPVSQFGNKENHQRNSRFKTFEQISNEIWDISLKYVNSHNGKSHLVLTRLNNVIPDDELLHWKRLSLNTKNLFLIVLTVNVNSNFLFNYNESSLQSNSQLLFPGSQSLLSNKFVKKFKPPNSVGSTNSGFTPFLMNDSPENFNINSNVATTPSEMYSPNAAINSGLISSVQNKQFQNFEDVSIIDITNEAYGIVLPNPVPLSNQPNRISIKTGYLYKVVLDVYNDDVVTANGNNHESMNEQPPYGDPNMITSARVSVSLSNGKIPKFKNSNLLEVNLMSCPSLINSFDLIKTILTQYRSLSNLGTSWGINNSKNQYDDENENVLIPWHILAVRKALNGLVHVRVE